MNRFITFALVVLASIASGSCAPSYGSNTGYSADVQQVSLSSYPNIDQYLNAPSYNAPSYAAPSYAPATSVVVPSAPSYASASAQNSAAAPSYNSQAAPQAYGSLANAPANGYGSAPSYAIQPAYTSQIYAGQQNYKAYAAPKVSSRVSLPIIPTEPVARLYVPRQNAYGSNASY